jgi:Zn-dependent protease
MVYGFAVERARHFFGLLGTLSAWLAAFNLLPIPRSTAGV